jgi:hypothetical protein
MNGQLLAVVGVDKEARVVCQAPGCGHGVYRRIHVVRHDDGRLGVYGSDCFERLFGHLLRQAPRYGSGEGRDLTAEERLMLAENTERLISSFEAEHEVLLEQARLRQEQQAKVERAAAERVERLRAEAEKRRPPSPAEIASVEREAKAIVRQKYDVDPDAPGWRGLVLAEANKLLGR